MVNRLKWLLQKLRRHPFVQLVIGTMVVWSLENYFAYLQQAKGGRWNLLRLLLVVVSVVLLYWLGRAIWRRIRPAPKLLLGFPPPPLPGLIFLYSKPDTLRHAIHHHRLRLHYLCLIVSQESLAGAREAVATFLAEGLLTEQPHEVLITDAWNPDETLLAVERAIQTGRDQTLEKAEIICDVTGGTKAMTTGAVLACLAADLLVQMVPAEYDKSLEVMRPVDVIQLQLR